MKLLIAFLFFSFAIAATTMGERLLRRPWMQVALCAVVASLFYSIRFVQ